MSRTVFSSFILVIALAGATTLPQRFFLPNFNLVFTHYSEDGTSPGNSEDGQRWVFALQYIASDYHRAVQNGQIVDSLEYGEMQRFARNLGTAYQASPGKKKPIASDLRQLEHLIADKAELKQIRAACRRVMAAIIKDMNLLVFPHVSLDLANGQRLFRENCVSCHGERGAGDGPAADTLNPKPRDFTDPERLQAFAPHQFFQTISFGVEGTAMPSFAEAFTKEECWDIAFYLMTLRRDFHPTQPAEPTADYKLTLQQLATKNNQELAAILMQQNRRKPAPDFNALVDYCRQNPPQPAMEEYLDITEKLLKQSLAAYARGDSTAANQYAYDAYWHGFESIERKLQYPLYTRFEQIYGDYNSCIEKPEQPEQAKALMKMMLDILHHIRKGKGWRSGA